MKKEKQENPLKLAKKKTRNNIQVRLIKVIKTITTELGNDALDIEKEAKKLAKKITKQLKISEIIKANNVKKTVIKPKKLVGKSIVSTIKKPVAKAVPLKPITRKKVKK